MSKLRVGDRVELRAKGTVSNISVTPTGTTVAVNFDNNFFVAQKFAASLDPKLLANLSVPREMLADEIQKLADDEL
jgi:hypothetical protein